MTEDEYDRPSFWDGVKDAARWFKDQFAAFFATFWLYVILWVVVGGAFFVLLYIDGKFSRGLAEGASINPFSFQAMGWVYRLFAASFLMAAARCKFNGIRGGITLKFLGAFASVIVCLHAFGFGFEALSERRASALAAVQVAAIDVDAGTESALLLEKQKADIRADLERAIKPLDDEISTLTSDGALNDDLADAARQRRANMQDAAQKKIDAIDAQILALASGNSTAKQEKIEAETNARPWAPLFVGMAQLFTWSKEPTEWAIYICAVCFIIFWVLLAEALVIFLPERIYVMHLHDAKIAADKRALEAPAPGPDEVVVKFTQQEWVDVQKAVDHRKNFEAGIQRAADERAAERERRRDAIKIEDGRDAMRREIDAMISLKESGVLLADISASKRMTVNQLERYYSPFLSDAEFAILFDHDRPVANGADHIPPETEEPPNGEADARE